MMPPMRDIAIIVLTAGEGIRMRSSLPKVMHKAGGRSLLGHVLAAAGGLAPQRTVIVTAPGMENAASEALRFVANASIAIQEERQGRAHAVSMAKPALLGFNGTILVLYGDVPLISAETMRMLAESVT